MRWAELGLALFAGCVIGWLWGERPDLLRGFSWLGAMTAFGTVGAVLVAIWATRADSIRRIGERRRLHSVFRWILMVDAIRAQVKLEELSEIVQKFVELKPGEELTDEFRSYALDLADSLVTPSLDKHIESLVYLHHDTAEALAALAANLPSLQANSRQLFSVSVVEPGRQELAKVMVSRIEFVLDAMSDLSWGNEAKAVGQWFER